MKPGDYILIAATLLIILAWCRGHIFAFFARFTFAKGNPQKALKIFEIGDKFGGMKTPAMINYGYLALRTGDTKKAREVLTKAYNKEKTPILKKRINSILALVLWREGDLDGAIDMLEGVINGFQETMVYQNLGVFYVLKGDGDKAVEFNLKAYDYNPDDLGIMDNLAQSYVLCGEFDKAEELYNEILEKDPSFPEPYYGLGELQCKRGECEKGTALIEKALEKNYSYLSVKSKEEVKQMLDEYKKKEKSK